MGNQVAKLAHIIQSDSIVDGEGIRTVIWLQGCSHDCEGCHNPETHDFNGGQITDTNNIIAAIKKIKYQDGITFSGGEPFLQPRVIFEIAKFCKSIGLNVWCYSGFTFEELLEMAKTKNSILNALNTIDVLVDGKYIADKRSLNLKFRGSKNQRIINVPKSLEISQTVLIGKYK